MPINQAIIHHLCRNRDKSDIKTQLRTDINIAEGPMVSLFTQLKQAFQRSATRQYGLFDPEQTDNPLPGWLKQLTAENMSFLNVCEKTSQHFKLVLEQVDDAFDAYLFFVVEELLEEKFLYLFWVSHSDAQQIDSELDVAQVEFVDTAKLSYVLKLDFNQWEVKNWQQYLSVITSRGEKNLAHAFLQAIGFVSSVNLQQQTDEFLGLVSEYAKSLPSAQTGAYKNKVVDYCVEQDMQGNPINLKQLSQELDSQDPEAFLTFITEHQQEPKEEIYTHRSSIKKFVRFYGREKDLSISFSSDMMGDRVVYDADSGELTLRKIPKSLQQQLAKYLKKT